MDPYFVVEEAEKLPKIPIMDLTEFARNHAGQITATIGLVTFALAKNKLTPGGIITAIIVATVHMLDPYPVFFWLLVPFFLLGVLVTKIGHAEKARLTKSSDGSSGGEGPRNWMQVVANGGVASVLILLHTYLNMSRPYISLRTGLSPRWYAPELERLLPIGIIAHYGAVAADTFGSELGILAKSTPVLVTAPWKNVPRGTNGGITKEGLGYGLLASFLITAIAYVGAYIMRPYTMIDMRVGILVCVMGVFGSLLDSFLGATVQATVTDRNSGKVVEGPGGQRVKVLEGGSRVQLGRDILTNNGVNLAMAALTSLSAMAVAWAFGLGF
ncbi:hypothetical protein Q7P37_007063 [Cladosporium fusiforme]